ncbi:MAG: hypothetical protein JZU52_08480 [Lamprocystis purpurea]|jgi:hypothetical protein|uniref:hypothetical protein n=1 Tax=Lamprocystis purpurea TaxID=61598 RepID=UPI00036929E2|nr:hypothetical protein [Lamprocystis purpurea]MBV5273664.1 hypothetical protein [Lamprocystis purpurea]
MNGVSYEDQQILDSLRTAVAEALDRKRRLGHYAVVWRDGKAVILGDESSEKDWPALHHDTAAKGRTLGDLIEPIVGD